MDIPAKLLNPRDLAVSGLGMADAGDDDAPLRTRSPAGCPPFSEVSKKSCIRTPPL
jgi:hypothetical protein